MNVFRLAKDVVVGRARNLSDKNLFDHLSLVALLAWVGLGADGLSSLCYGPEAAFLALKSHTPLSLFVAGATVLTIIIICTSYSQIIEAFPTGGGGYLVASKLLSPTVGVVSGCALIGDYILTIALSVASGADAMFSLLPPQWFNSLPSWHMTMTLEEKMNFYKVVFSLGIIVFLTLLAVVLRAYSLGAGTYTGIEAVSNGLNTLREPRVQTGKRTMIYMAASLSVGVGGLMLAYLLYHVTKVADKTLNAVLFENITAAWPPLASKSFVIAAMASSAALLFIAAQTGFFGGPRVLANMAVDRWMPTRFATLSDRLVTQNGVLLMGLAALLVIVVAALFAKGGLVNTLVVLYSINVFITFSLSQLGMVRHWWLERAQEPKWKNKIFINGFGLLLTSGILVSLCVVKFDEGGWVTLLVTGALVGVAFWVKNHYRQTQKKLYRLNELVAAALADEAVTAVEKPPIPCNPNARTAVFLVNGFNGLGLHTLLAVVRMFPKVYDNFIFLQVGVLDAGNFKGAAEVENLREHAQHEVNRYVAYMGKRGFHTEAHFALGTDIVDEAAKLCDQIADRFPQAQFFAGQLVFKDENIITGWLHNHTVFELQRRLYQHGRAMLILPIQV